MNIYAWRCCVSCVILTNLVINIYGQGRLPAWSGDTNPSGGGENPPPQPAERPDGQPDAESPLGKAIQQVQDRVNAESRAVRESRDKPGDGVGNRLMAFLSSTAEIKYASNIAAIQLKTLKQCRSQSGLSKLSCPNFFENVGRLCEGDHNLRSHQSHDASSQSRHHSALFPERYPGYRGSTIPQALDECPLGDAPVCGEDTMQFRTFDGTCNNRAYTLSGAANRALGRDLPAHYSDCVEEFRRSARYPYKALPSARAVSQKMHTGRPVISAAHTVMHMTFGQLVDHDMDITAVSKFADPDADGELVNVACGDNGCQTDGMENQQCAPMEVPENDGFFTNKPCLKFVRSQEFLTDGCETGARQQPNQITSWLDAAFLYGNSDTSARSLRSFQHGRMNTSRHPLNPSFKDLMPIQHDGACRNATEELNCFQAGDGRRNEQVGLQALHTIFVRYHNYLTAELQARHSDWSDEQLYQTARKLCGGVWQHIVYNEYVALTLGPQLTKLFDLLPRRFGYYNGYTNDRAIVNPDTKSEFATAAFRFGHSQIGDTLRFIDHTYTEYEDVHFSRVFFNPSRIYHSGVRGDDVSGVTAVMLGMAHQPADKTDLAFSAQVFNHLFTGSPPHGGGTDLPATNMQRGRDHGLPGYNDWREWCKNLLDSKDRRQKLLRTGKVRSFGHLKRRHHGGNMHSQFVHAFQSLYDHVDDIDLFPAGLAEDTVFSGLVGPTFGCILAKQFSDLKRGDRFFYENPGQFETAQLKNIKQQTFSSIICQTLEDDRDPVNHPDTTLRIQKYAMLQSRDAAMQHLVGSAVNNAPELYNLHHFYKNGDTNERQLCEDIPALDFDLF